MAEKRVLMTTWKNPYIALLFVTQYSVFSYSVSENRFSSSDYRLQYYSFFSHFSFTITNVLFNNILYII